MDYESTLSFEAESVPGVRFTIRRVSLARRNELVERVRALSAKTEFLAAGGALGERIEANLLAGEMEAIYLRWGLVKLEGLSIDGSEADTELLIERGPEELSREIARAVKRQIGLSEEERKN